MFSNEHLFSCTKCTKDKATSVQNDESAKNQTNFKKTLAICARSAIIDNVRRVQKVPQGKELKNMKARKYEFYIIDRQYDDEYDYIAYFEDDFEAMKFVEENLSAGNTVVIRSIKNVLVEKIDAWFIKEI